MYSIAELCQSLPHDTITCHPIDPTFIATYNDFLRDRTNNRVVTVALSDPISTTAEILAYWLWMISRNYGPLTMNVIQSNEAGKVTVLIIQVTYDTLTFQLSDGITRSSTGFNPSILSANDIQQFLVQLRRSVIDTNIPTIVTDKYRQQMVLKCSSLLNLPTIKTSYPIQTLMTGNLNLLVVQLTENAVSQLVRDGYKSHFDDDNRKSLVTPIIVGDMYVIVAYERRLLTLLYDWIEKKGSSTVQLTLSVYPKVYWEKYIEPHWSYIGLSIKCRSITHTQFLNYAHRWGVNTCNEVIDKFCEKIMSGWMEWDQFPV